MSRHFRGGLIEDDHVYVALMRERDEARAAAEKLQAVIDKACAALIGSQHVGSPPEREVWRAVCDLLMSLRTKYTADGALSGGGGQ